MPLNKETKPWCSSYIQNEVQFQHKSQIFNKDNICQGKPRWIESSHLWKDSSSSRKKVHVLSTTLHVELNIAFNLTSDIWST